MIAREIPTFQARLAALAVVGAALTASAQPLIVVTSQTRTVTASTNCTGEGCVPQTVTNSAPDNGNWTGSASAESRESAGTPWATASVTLTSSYGENGIGGSVTASAFGSGMATGSSTGTGSVTFTLTRAMNMSAGGGTNPCPAGASVSLRTLAGQFIWGGGMDCVYTSAPTVLLPGEYVLTWSYGASYSNGSGGGTRSMNFGIQMTPFVPVVAGPITRPGSCPEHRYYQLAGTTWSQAEQLAMSMGGHLTTVNDASEQAWLVSTFATLGPANKWIGLRRTSGTAPFQWVSGDPAPYRNWAPNNPVSGAGRTDNVVYMDSATSYRWRPFFDVNNNPPIGGIVEVIPCRCDWNGDGARSSEDFFAFLVNFFEGTADFNCSGTTTSADFFEFLSCLLATTCP